VAAATRAATDIGSAGGGSRVIATDYDEFALRLVEAAAREQGLQSILSTQIFDLTCTQAELPEADLYVMSDVFECSKVAVGAAKQTLRALDLGKRAWIFAQSDRAQRETYRDYLNELLSGRISVEWTEMARLEDYADEPLVLFDVDETKVEYC
jgi:predicted nicotinamide N-methyase